MHANLLEEIRHDGTAAVRPRPRVGLVAECGRHDVVLSVARSFIRAALAVVIMRKSKHVRQFVRDRERRTQSVVLHDRTTAVRVADGSNLGKTCTRAWCRQSRSTVNLLLFHYTLYSPSVTQLRRVWQMSFLKNNTQTNTCRSVWRRNSKKKHNS